MIEIKIPKEITEYKEKILFGLTIRQCVCAVAALAVCVPLYIFGKDFLGDDVVGWLVIMIAVPIFAFGFFGYDGMPYFLLAIAFSYMLSGYFGLYQSQKIVYSKYKTNYINKKTH